MVLKHSTGISFRFIPSARELNEIAIRKAKKAAVVQGKERNKRNAKKIKALRIVSEYTDYLTKVLLGFVQRMPTIEKMPAFYKELLKEILDVHTFKKALGHTTKTITLIESLHRKALFQMRAFPSGNVSGINGVQKQFLARSASILKKADESFSFLNKSLKQLKELPEINEDAFTIVLAGFPNTGKSTLLNALTGSKSQIASYPFTTTALMLGSFDLRFREYQVIDTPGLLDRPLEKRNPIERKALSALNHLADLIIFLFDATGSCGYTMQEQFQLLQSIQKQFNTPLKILLSKKDIATEAQFQEAHSLLSPYEVLENGEGMPVDKKTLITLAK
jgi:nucleolar GTP-binding protein